MHIVVLLMFLGFYSILQVIAFLVDFTCDLFLQFTKFHLLFSHTLLKPV